MTSANNLSDAEKDLLLWIDRESQPTDANKTNSIPVTMYTLDSGKSPNEIDLIVDRLRQQRKLIRYTGDFVSGKRGREPAYALTDLGTEAVLKIREERERIVVTHFITRDEELKVESAAPTEGPNNTTAAMDIQYAGIKVLTSSPSDVQEERNTIRETVTDWNGLHADAEGTVLIPLAFERDATPAIGQAQEIINEQLVDQSDILVCVFWTRLGTPTNRAKSGTVEEIERAIKQRKQVIIYFSSRASDPSTQDPMQLKAVHDYRNDVQATTALTGTFKTVEELKFKLMSDLTRTARKVRSTKRTTVPASKILQLTCGIMIRMMLGPGKESIQESVFSVHAVNISPRPVTLTTLMMRVSDGRAFQCIGSPMSAFGWKLPAKLNDSDAVSIDFPVATMRQILDMAGAAVHLTHAVVYDTTGRPHVSDELPQSITERVRDFKDELGGESGGAG